MNPLESQVGGSHYKDMKIQPAEFCHANGIPYLEGCAIKYICRHRAKNKAEDIRKAIHFLKLLLKLEYGADEQADAVPDVGVTQALRSALNIQLDSLYGPQYVPATKQDMRVGQEVGDVKREEPGTHAKLEAVTGQKLDLNMCLSQNPGDVFCLCTRPVGHAGSHVAGNPNHPNIAVWDDQP